MSAVVNSPPDVLNPQVRKIVSEPEMAMEAERGEHRFRDLYQKGKEKAVQVEHDFEGYVRAHPVKSVLIATGVGVALGYLFTRKR